MYQRLSPCKILAGFQGNHDITPASPTAMRGQAEQLLGFSQWPFKITPLLSTFTFALSLPFCFETAF